MKAELQKHLSNACFLEEQGHQYGYLLSVFRYILQVSAYSAFEASRSLAEPPEQFADLPRKLLQPADGDFVYALDICIPPLTAVMPGLCKGWFDSRGTGRTESGRDIANSIISKRNDRVGHGVFDLQSIHEELETLPSRIEALIDILYDLLPEIKGSSEGFAELQTPVHAIPVEVVRRHRGELVLVRKIECRGSVWRLKGQALNPKHSKPAQIEISDKCGLISELTQKSTDLAARNILIDDALWRTTVQLPLRQTQTFEGRGDEIVSLKEWWDDPDSRACLVFGEGGIGKTTLVLEFLNDLLDSPPSGLAWKPELIFFYSAKLTRWGVAGMEQIGGINANVNEALRSLARVLEPRLGVDWQSEDSRSLISKVATLFGGVGLNRDDLLFVLDNTETLARTSAEETGLGKTLREISTKVGRLLVTSRRRESFECAQIPVPPLSEDVGAMLLQKLAQDYEASAILQAGDPRRRKICRQFGGKPILLDVLARHVANTGCGIDDGIAAILSQERGDLGAFLFADAWKRMEPEFRDVFLALGQLGGAVSDQMLTWACAEFTCYAPNWLSAFEETRFGSLVDYGTHFDLSLDSGAREFLAAEYDALKSTDRQRIASAVGRIRKKNIQAISAAEGRVSDRVIEAFRTTAAKAAKLAASRRDVDEAIRWYEEATIADSANAALFDRYAWYLMVNDRLEKAAVVSRKAIEIEPNDSDCQFTAGMIAARKGNISEADSLLNRAQELGKAPHLVNLQKARARLERAVQPEQENDAERRGLAQEAISLLEASTPSSRGNHEKHNLEKAKLLRRCYGVIETSRPIRKLSVETPVKSKPRVKADTP